MAPKSGSRVVVVGGGIIGCSIARELAGCGCNVVLLERSGIGSEASSAAAGILAPQLEAEAPTPLLDLGVESMRLYPDFVTAVRQETGIDPGFNPSGTLLLDLTREDEAASRKLCAWQERAGLAVEFLSARAIAGLEPGLADSILGGLFFPRSGSVDPAALTRALGVSARCRGVDVREGAPVDRLRDSGGRVSGVEAADGEVLEADHVVLAAGAWSSTLAPEIPVKVFPVRGQMLAVDTRRPARTHVLYTRRVYTVPRRDGRVLIGSTSEPVGYQKAVTPRALMKLTAAALATDPTLENANFAAAWSGLRPATGDGLPLLGQVRPGLVAATGHHRNGILLAPITAALVAELILRGKTTRSLESFSPLRKSPSPRAGVSS